MPDKYHALRSVLIAALLPAIIAAMTVSDEPALSREESYFCILHCSFAF